MRPLAPAFLLALIAIAGCEGRIGSSAGRGDDAGIIGPGMDSGTIIPMHDTGMPGHDAWSPQQPDAWVAPPPDAWSAPPPDAWVDPTCTSGSATIPWVAGCDPSPVPNSGDPYQDCVDRINQFRCVCQHLPPLMRWRAGEACADQMAMYDATHTSAGPHAGFIADICEPRGYGENECPGWPSVDSTISGCLAQMWDEGPGDFYGPPEHGHYLNMSSQTPGVPPFTMVACGFYTGSGGVYAVQNFQ